MTRELQDDGFAIGRRRTARLMRENGLRGRQKRRFKRTTDSEHSCPGPYMLEAGISSTYRIAVSWGIVPATAPVRQHPALDRIPSTGVSPKAIAGRRFDPGRVIDDALRAAGLMKP